MIILNYKNSFIYYEEFKYNTNFKLKEFIDKSLYKEIIDNININLVLVLGGDGTMLGALKKLMFDGLPFLGINFGTKGFLLNDNIPKNNLKYNILDYPIFELEVENNKFYCFNEFDIRSSDGKILTLDISINNCTGISISGDGIIVSTPLGSTGYNSSLGGPIIPHNLNAYVLTPKAAWKPKGQQPILLNDKEILTINNSGRINAFEIFSDGKTIFKSDNKTTFTIKKSFKKINFIVFDEYLDTWDLKVFFEQGFQRKNLL